MCHAIEKNKTLRLLLIFFLTFAIPAVCTNMLKLHINTTESMVRGIWQESPITEEIKPGTAVLVKRDMLNLNNKLVTKTDLLKRVCGVAGNTVDYDEALHSIKINGKVIAHSSLYTRDKHGDMLPRPLYPYEIPPGHVYLASEHLYGYDSRYFGTVPLTAVYAKAKLILSW